MMRLSATFRANDCHTPLSTSDKSHYVAHGLALLTEIRTWCVEKGAVAKNHQILLANPEMSFYCTIVKFLVASTKINNKIRMAGVYVHRIGIFIFCA